MYKKVGVVLLGLAIVGTAGYIIWSKQSKTTCVERARFCIQHSKAWQPENLEEKGLANFIDLRLKHHQKNATFQVRSQAGGSNKSPEQLKDAVTDNLSQELDKFQLRDSRSQAVADTQALRLVYDYTYQNNKKQEVRSRQLMLIVPSNARVYYITGQSSPETFKDLEPNFSQLIERFRYIK